MVQLLCAYSGDGATALANCHPPGLSATCTPGCVHSAGFCDRLQPVLDGWCQCSLGWCRGEPLRPQPWAPSDLDAMLTQYDAHGLTPSAGNNNNPASAGGWNELIIGTDQLATSLPHAIEAFFYVKDVAWDVRTSTRRVVEEFAMAFNYGGRPELPPPLLTLRKDDWDRPFADGAFS